MSKMDFCMSIRSMNLDELQYRRKSLRDAVVCIGWLKILSMIFYISLYVLVYGHSKGPWSTAIQIMVLAVIPIQIVNGILLFWGATEEKVMALELAMWMCVTIAGYNSVLGLIGGIFFIRTGFLMIHFVMAIMFSVLSLSLFAVMCHDIIVIYTFKTLAKSPLSLATPPETKPPSILNKIVNNRPWP